MRTAREHAGMTADTLLQETAAEAEKEARRLRAEAEGQAAQMAQAAEHLDISFLSSHIDRISGIRL